MNRLKQIRKENNETQVDLSKFLNMEQSTISNWENDRTEIDQDNLNRIAKHYNVSLDYLIGENAKPKIYGTVLTELESDVVKELRRMSKNNKQTLARIIFSFTENDYLINKYREYSELYEIAANS